MRLALLCFLPFVLWVFFLAYTALKANWKTLRFEVKVVGGVVVAVGLVIDLVFNLIASILLLDAPQEWTFSQKCGRLKRTEGWRAAVAQYSCANLLDPFEQGGHCR